MSREDMHEAIKKNLKEKTGKTLPEWVSLLKKKGPKDKKDKMAWLKSEQGLGHIQAKIVIKEAEG